MSFLAAFTNTLMWPHPIPHERKGSGKPLVAQEFIYPHCTGSKVT